MYRNYTRVQGGSSYADAVFRGNASSKNYAEVMIRRKLEKEWGDMSPFAYHSAENFFIISYEDKPVIIKDFEFVEKKRSESVHAFEEWLLEVIHRHDR